MKVRKAAIKTISSITATSDNLRRQWYWTAAFWLAIWLAAYFLLSRLWTVHANRWMALSAVFLIVIWWRVHQNLDLNHRPGERRLLPRLGAANQLSLLRGLGLGLLAGFLFSPWPPGALAWLIAGLYTAICIADGLDGYIARRRDEVTELGALLDIEYDALGVAIVTVLAVGYSQLPAWFLLVGFARYAFVAGLWWRERAGKPTRDLFPSVHRRILAGMLMGMMTVVLWPIVPAEMVHVAAIVISVPLLLGFLRDWLFVSGRLAADSQPYARIRRSANLLFTRRLPLLWRLLLAGSVIAILLRAEGPWYQPAAWVALLQSWGLPGAFLVATLLALLGVVGAACIAAGTLGRVFAILLLFPIGFDISTAGLDWLNGLCLVCALLIAFFGTGPYSLWQPEDDLLVPRGDQEQALSTIAPQVSGPTL